MRIYISALIILILSASLGFGAEGLVVTKSPYSVSKTMDRLSSIVTKKGMTIFARIDHSKGAKKIGKTLRPTEVILFGNPTGGTPFMECAQTVGIDLPLKILAWEDTAGQVWLSFNDPAYLARRHGTSEENCPVVTNLITGLANISKKATGP